MVNVLDLEQAGPASSPFSVTGQHWVSCSFSAQPIHRAAILRINRRMKYYVCCLKLLCKKQDINIINRFYPDLLLQYNTFAIIGNQFVNMVTDCSCAINHVM